jgi:hypothetical protein
LAWLPLAFFGFPSSWSPNIFVETLDGLQERRRIIGSSRDIGGLFWFWWMLRYAASIRATRCVSLLFLVHHRTEEITRRGGMEGNAVARFRFYVGVFVIAAATLMLQIIETRIISVTSWYHLAFFVISTAMFGLTAGAVWVYLWCRDLSARELYHRLTIHLSGGALLLLRRGR